MLLVKAFPRIPPISTFSSFMNFWKEQVIMSKKHFSPALQWKRIQASCGAFLQRSRSVWTRVVPETPKNERASPGLWSRKAELSCIPERGSGRVGFRFGPGIVPTKKQVLNSFKLRMETFTLSSPSSTWIENVELCSREAHLNLENWVGVEELAGHVYQEVAGLLQSNLYIFNERDEDDRDLHQYDDPVRCVVELGAAVDQTHLQTKVKILISFLLFFTVCIRGANKGRTSAKSAASRVWIWNSVTIEHFCKPWTS